MKLVFYGLDAFLRSHSGRRIYFSTENPSDGDDVFVPLDLDKTPSAAQAGRIRWGDVIVDDFGEAQSKLTTLAPDRSPRRTGGVWVEERHLNLLRRLFDLPVPHPKQAGTKPYEHMSVRYYAEDPSGDRKRVGTRYLGFHARMVNPETRTVQVWHAGTYGDEAGKKPVEIPNVDFADPSKVDYHKSRHGETELAATDAAGTEGALFLSDDYARMVELHGNKKPPGDGI
jgi:hypothetical protein